MIHRWQFNEMWQYFDYNADAIYKYSEEIANLPEQYQKEVFDDIANRIRSYFAYYRGSDDELNQLVGCIVIDIYRTMNKAIYYTEKQAYYLESTAKVMAETLKQQGIVVHFGSNNSFDHPNPELLKLMFEAFWESCGFKLYQTIMPEGKSKEAILATARACCNTVEWCAIMIPYGNEDDFSAMLNTVNKPGVMNFFKSSDALVSKCECFPYLPANAKQKEEGSRPQEKGNGEAIPLTPEQLAELKTQYMKSAGYLVDVLHPLFVETASAEKMIYNNPILRQTRAENILSAFRKIEDRSKEAVDGLPDIKIVDTESNALFCNCVLSANMLFLLMVKFRIAVLSEYIKNGLTQNAKDTNEQALELCGKYDKIMPTVIDEMLKREGDWING